MKTMKKIGYRVLAAVFTMAVIMTAPAATLKSHALGFNSNAPEDTTDYGKMPDNYWEDFRNSLSSSDNGSSCVEPTQNEPTQSEPTQSEPAYSEPSNTKPAQDNANYGVNPSKNTNNVVVNIAGGQKFCNVMSTDHTSYQVYHCGISRASFNVTNADGNVVAYKTVKLEQGEDELWYENITFADDVDTKGLTLNVTKGDATYLSTTLGVSGIKINGIVALSTVPAEPVQVDEDPVVGHRYCDCGASFEIKNSGLDKDAWSAHIREHAAKGESARWTDK